MIKIKFDKNEENKFITKMISNNNIDVIVPFIIKENNLIIDDSNLLTLKDKLKGLINSKDLLKLFNQIFNCVEAINKYMIDEGYIYYDLDKIFVQGNEILLLINPYMKDDKSIRDLIYDVFRNYKIDEEDFDMRLIRLKNELVNEDYELIVLKKIINENINYKNLNKSDDKKNNTIKNNKRSKNILNLIKEKLNKKDEKIVEENDLDAFFRFPKNNRKKS